MSVNVKPDSIVTNGTTFEMVVKKRVRNVIKFPETKEFVQNLIATLDTRYDEMMDGCVKYGNHVEVSDPLYRSLGDVAGGILGAMKLNDWSNDKMIEYIVQYCDKRLPLDLIKRVTDRNENLLTFVRTRKLPSDIPGVEIYGNTYLTGDGVTELSYIDVCDGYDDFDGMYGIWPVRENSRDQWREIVEDLKQRGVEKVHYAFLNLPSSHILEEGGFVEAFCEQFPDSKPCVIIEGMYVS